MISRYAYISLLAAVAACGRSDRPASEPPAAAPSRRPSSPPAVVFLGTSLTAGLGVDLTQAYPALIQEKLDSARLGFRVYNAGVSGETSAGARERIDWLLQRQPAEVLVVETGANDGLRGLAPAALRANLEAILDRALAQRPPPALIVVGMEAPPNLGSRYTGEFRSIFAEVASEKGAALVPFLLAGVAGIDTLNQGDGIHPTPEGQRIMAETVWRVLEPLLRARVAEAARGTAEPAS